MKNAVDVFSVMNSEMLRSLDIQVATALKGNTLTRANASKIAQVVQSVIEDPLILLRDLISYAFSSEQALDTLVEAFDEKEYWIRLFLHEAEMYSLRLHIWLPSRGEGTAIETSHSHRRYLVSHLLNNAYTSYEFQRDPSKAIKLIRTREVPAGASYVIAPETIHAISNQTTFHTVSLIVRGNAVTDHIEFFHPETGALVEHIQQRPVGDLGKTETEKLMDRRSYLSYRLLRLARECKIVP